MSDISQHMQGKQETLDSAVSYTVGGGGAAIASLVEISNVAQSIAIVLGCIVVAIRLVHDAVRLYRFIKNK